MKKWMLLVVIVVVALVAVIALVPAALAQGPTNGYGPSYGRNLMFNGTFGPSSRMEPDNAPGPMFGIGPRWGGPDNSLVVVAAEQLGLTPTELITELQSGKTIAQVAAEHNVVLDTIVDAFLASRAEWLTEQVANGQLTQEQADALLASMKANVTARLNQEWSPPGFGQENCPGFVDEDGDGICDHAGSGQGPGQGDGSGFVDEDGDGVCDYAGSGGRPGRGGRMGRWAQ